jgi:hypothetical protein
MENLGQFCVEIHKLLSTGAERGLYGGHCARISRGMLFDQRPRLDGRRTVVSARDWPNLMSCIAPAAVDGGA